VPEALRADPEVELGAGEGLGVGADVGAEPSKPVPARSAFGSSLGAFRATAAFASSRACASTPMKPLA
jgi:hypothetical protein